MKNLTIVMTIMVMVLASVGTAEAVNYPSYKPNDRSGVPYEHTAIGNRHVGNNAYSTSTVEYRGGRYVTNGNSVRGAYSRTGSSRIPSYRSSMRTAAGMAGSGLPGEDGLGENDSYGMSSGPRRVYTPGSELDGNGNYWDDEAEEWLPVPVTPGAYVGQTKTEGGKNYVWNGSEWIEQDAAEVDAPIGTTPWLLMLLLAGGYAALAARRRKAA